MPRRGISSPHNRRKKMINREKEKENFKNHVATLTDYGNIKILDFKNPESVFYRIRFMFEEDNCRLHISGDLGELIASNYNNMTFEGFKDFIHNPCYFIEKIDCCSRPIYVWDEDKAIEEVKEYIEDNDYGENIHEIKSWCDTKEEAVTEFLIDVMEDFSDDRGIGSKGYDALSEIDYCEDVDEIGREMHDIIELYLFAFELATEKLKGGEINE